MNAMTKTELPRAIDREALAARVLDARTDRDLTQEALAAKITSHAITKSFLSSLERANVAFREPSTFERVEAICKFLAVDIPWITADSRKANAIVPSKKKLPPTIDEKIEDGEVTAIYICNRAIAKLGNPESIGRVIAYLQARYLKTEAPKPE